MDNNRADGCRSIGTRYELEVFVTLNGVRN